MSSKVRHRVCVFCSASNDVHSDYKQLAQQCGTALGKAGFDVVYGGGDSGLMGIVSSTAHAAGAHVMGIFPIFLEEYEGLKQDLDNTILVDTMSSRKDMLLERADSFLILPGGFGTLDEIFEVLTLAAHKQHFKHTIILNYKGYWDPLLKLFDHVIEHHFASPKLHQFYTVVDSLPAAMVELKKLAR